MRTFSIGLLLIYLHRRLLHLRLFFLCMSADKKLSFWLRGALHTVDTFAAVPNQQTRDLIDVEGLIHFIRQCGSALSQCRFQVRKRWAIAYYSRCAFLLKLPRLAQRRQLCCEPIRSITSNRLFAQKSYRL